MKNNHINYIEFKAIDLEEIEKFYHSVFGWEFTSYGLEYISFKNAGIEGGFHKSEAVVEKGVLVVLYHNNLNIIKEKIIQENGKITQDIFSFPGGKRFHFSDPSGNELAVWCEE
ncbi:MAG: VOC family protein [Brumimicrobium sp.]